MEQEIKMNTLICTAKLEDEKYDHLLTHTASNSSPHWGYSSESFEYDPHGDPCLPKNEIQIPSPPTQTKTSTTNESEGISESSDRNSSNLLNQTPKYFVKEPAQAVTKAEKNQSEENMSNKERIQQKAYSQIIENCDK